MSISKGRVGLGSGLLLADERSREVQGGPGARMYTDLWIVHCNHQCQVIDRSGTRDTYNCHAANNKPRQFEVLCQRIPPSENNNNMISTQVVGQIKKQARKEKVNQR